MDADKITIRPLKVRDSRFLMRMLKKLIEESKERWIETLISAGVDTEETAVDETADGVKYLNLFSDIVALLIANFENEITEWFADLSEITHEEYENLPFGIDLDIIQQIGNDENFRSFFSKAWAFARNHRTFGPIIESVKTRYDSLIASPSDSSEISIMENTGSVPATS